MTGAQVAGGGWDPAGCSVLLQGEPGQQRRGDMDGTRRGLEARKFRSAPPHSSQSCSRSELLFSGKHSARGRL
uniref:Uncharacterized protein n=1 Tax=Knipowitschia caucasica TaxID=637954 RepID=A0AAV2KLA1_KNICA